MPQSVAAVSAKETWANAAATPRLLLTFSHGLNENIQPALTECTQGYNFDLKASRQSLVQRLPFMVRGTAPNTAQITAILQLIKRDDTETTIVASGTVLYYWDGSTTWTSKATIVAPAKLHSDYWALTDILVIADQSLNNPVSQWDGTTFSTLTTGLAHSLYAKYVYVFNDRVWLFNITYNGVNYPHMILVSAFENPNSYDTSARGGPSTVGGGTFSTGLEAFYLFVPDLRPINAVEVFQNVLVISTLDGSVWQLSGTSAKDYQFTQFHFGFPPLSDVGMKNIGGDIITVSKGGHISLLYAVQAYGDMLAADLSYWLPTTLPAVQQINAVVDDIGGQRVLFFVDDQVLVLFKELLAQDRGRIVGSPSPWSIYRSDYASGLATLAADYLRIPGSTDYSVLFGGPDGDIYDLNGTGFLDAGDNEIRILRRSRHIGTEVLNPWPWMEDNLIGRVRYRRMNQANFNLTFEWDDEYSITEANLVLKGPSAADTEVVFGGSVYFGGPFYFGQGFPGLGRVASQNVEPAGKGPGFYLTVTSNATKQIQVDAVELD